MADHRPAGQSAIIPRFLDQPKFVALLYLVLTLVMTLPLAWRWRDSIPAGAGDIWQNYWNFWWWKQCLLEGFNPLHSPLLFFPNGANLVFHTHSPFNQVLAMPVNLHFGEAAAYNFCILFALTLTGFGTYLLVRELTGSAEAGVLAGIVFAYFPQTIEQTLEHLNLFSLQFIPLALFCLLRWSRSLRLIDALAFGACFGLNALCSWHLGLKLGIVVTPWMAWLLWHHRQRWREYLGGAGAAAALAVLLVLPLLVPIFALIADGNDYFLKQAVPRGIDPTYLVTPPYANPVLGQLVTDRYLDRAYQASGFICYLGFIPIALAMTALVRARRKTWPWLALFASGVVLALGAEPLWNGTLHRDVTLPFAVLREIPLLQNLRVANRFMILAGLALAVLAGYGWQSLRIKSRWALPVIAALILVEFSWLPFPLQRVEFSPLLKAVASRPGAVLDIPFHQRSRAVGNMANQTVHGRPIGDGYLSSYPPAVDEAIKAIPAFSQIVNLPQPDAVVNVDALRALGFRTIAIHKDRSQGARERLLAETPPDALLELKRVRRLGGVPDATIDALRAQLDQALGGADLEDDLLAIYFLDEADGDR